MPGMWYELERVFKAEGVEIGQCPWHATGVVRSSIIFQTKPLLSMSVMPQVVRTILLQQIGSLRWMSNCRFIHQRSVIKSSDPVYATEVILGLFSQSFRGFVQTTRLQCIVTWIRYVLEEKCVYLICWASCSATHFARRNIYHSSNRGVFPWNSSLCWLSLHRQIFVL